MTFEREPASEISRSHLVCRCPQKAAVGNLSAGKSVRSDTGGSLGGGGGVPDLVPVGTSVGVLANEVGVDVRVSGDLG